MPLAIIGLVCPEARVKFKNIDFRTKADFACYCIIVGPPSTSLRLWSGKASVPRKQVSHADLPGTSIYSAHTPKYHVIK